MCWLAFNPVKDFIDVGYLFIYFLLLPAWFSGLWLNYPIQWDPRHWAKSQLRLFPWVRRGKTETRCLVMLHTHGRDLILFFFFPLYSPPERERERDLFPWHDSNQTWQQHLYRDKKKKQFLLSGVGLHYNSADTDRNDVAIKSIIFYLKKKVFLAKMAVTCPHAARGPRGNVRRLSYTNDMTVGGNRVNIFTYYS